MADPTIQTFCCHHGNRTDMSIAIIEQFNTSAYNLVSIFSSTVGIFGAIYQILPRHQYSSNHRWLSYSAERGRRLIIWLAIADLFGSLGVFARSSIWLNFNDGLNDEESQWSFIFCATSSAWIQYFYAATWIWTLCYAIDVRFILNERSVKQIYYHVAAWLIPFVLTFIGLSLLYFPEHDCHTSASLEEAIQRILPNYCATYLPIAIVMIANPCLYKMSCKEMQSVIITSSGQYTTRERNIIDAIETKFSIINLIFYICWLPNLINGILLWTLWFNLPMQVIMILWYIMALMNPLQALFNCLVYRRWGKGSEKVILPWNNTKTIQNYEDSNVNINNERMHLLRNRNDATNYTNS